MDEFVRRVERCEITAFEGLFRRASTRSTKRCGLRVAEFGSALATVASKLDVLAFNRVVGLGVERPASVQDLERIVRLFTAERVPRFFVHLAPGALPSDLPHLLTERGFRHYNNWVRLHRGVEPAPEVETELSVQEIDVSHATAFGRIVVKCFGWPIEAEEWVTEIVGRPGWRHYMAFDGATPVATGSLFVMNNCAWMGFASTLPEHRGRGAQGALVARRIRDAAELGCQQLVVETAEETPQKEAPSFRNMLRFGFRVAYLRPNYIFTPEPARAK